MELVVFVDAVLQVLAGAIERVGIYLEAAPVEVVECVAYVARARVRMERFKDEDFVLAGVRGFEPDEDEAESEKCCGFSEVYDFRLCLMRHDGEIISHLWRHVVQRGWG